MFNFLSFCSQRQSASMSTTMSDDAQPSFAGRIVSGSVSKQQANQLDIVVLSRWNQFLQVESVRKTVSSFAANKRKLNASKWLRENGNFRWQLRAHRRRRRYHHHTPTLKRIWILTMYGSPMRGFFASIASQFGSALFDLMRLCR